jgi:hypothetical protein
VHESVTVAVQVNGKVSSVLIHVCKYLYIYIQIYLYVCIVYIYVCIYIYIYIYIYTYIQIYFHVVDLTKYSPKPVAFICIVHHIHTHTKDRTTMIRRAHKCDVYTGTSNHRSDS